MDLITASGTLAIASRFRRLSEYIMKQGEDIYKLYGLTFSPQNFPVFYAVSQEGRMGIMELAQVLQLTHPAVIQQAKALEKQGLILSVRDKEDKRRRWLTLSDKGQKLLPTLQKVWSDIQETLDEAISSSPSGILENLSNLEDRFQEISLVRRVEKKRKERISRQIEIVPFTMDLAAHFARINYTWINKYFEIEDIDKAFLDHPQERIILPGGAILFAKLGDQIVGTVALIKKEVGVFELAKMGVDESYQGLYIGKKLGYEAIATAKKLGARRIFLESNRKLGVALQLYRKLGFREVVRKGNSDYSRSDIVMEMYA